MKIKCISKYVTEDLIIGKVYECLKEHRGLYYVKNESGYIIGHEKYKFEILN